MKKVREWVSVFRANPALAVGVLVAGGTALAQATNPLADSMNNIKSIICAVVNALTGPFGAALAIIMLALGFAGLIIGNRNAMGLIITAIAGGALLLAAKTLGNAILGATGC